MKIAFVAVAAFLSCSPLATAQMERTVYQSFEIDSVQTITLDIVGDYEVNVWAGNSILTETNIQIWKASPHLLDYFIEEGRYEIVATTTPSSATLSSKNPTRKPIKTKTDECTEIVTLKIFVPDTFQPVSPNDKKTLRKNG
ncbi:MAG: hypothetical protein ACK4Q5_04265 [Saprospiraceae bacterium]